jgi:hypothetical protein
MRFTERMSAEERSRWAVATAVVSAVPLFYFIFFHLTADDVAAYHSGGSITAISFVSEGRYLAAAITFLNNVLFGGNVAVAFIYKIGSLFAVSGIVFTLPIPNLAQENRASLIFRACAAMTIVSNPRFLDLLAFGTNAAATFAILALLLLFVVLMVRGRPWLAVLAVFVGLFFYQTVVVAAALLGFYILICDHLEQETPLRVVTRRVLFLAAALAAVLVVYFLTVLTLTKPLMSLLRIEHPTFVTSISAGTGVLGNIFGLLRIGVSDFFPSDWYGLTIGKRMADGEGYIERPELRLFTALVPLTIVALGVRSRRWVAVAASVILFVLSLNLLAIVSPSNLGSMRWAFYAGFFPFLVSALFLGVLSQAQRRVAVRLWIALAIVLSLNCARLSYDTHKLQQFEYSLAARIVARLEMMPGFVPGTSRISVDYRFSKPASSSLRMISISGLHGKLRAVWAQRQFLEHVAGYAIPPLGGNPGDRCGPAQKRAEDADGMNARIVDAGAGNFLVCIDPL